MRADEAVLPGARDPDDRGVGEVRRERRAARAQRGPLSPARPRGCRRRRWRRPWSSARRRRGRVAVAVGPPWSPDRASLTSSTVPLPCSTARFGPWTRLSMTRPDDRRARRRARAARRRPAGTRPSAPCPPRPAPRPPRRAGRPTASPTRDRAAATSPAPIPPALAARVISALASAFSWSMIARTSSRASATSWPMVRSVGAIRGSPGSWVVGDDRSAQPVREPALVRRPRTPPAGPGRADQVGAPAASRSAMRR